MITIQCENQKILWKQKHSSKNLHGLSQEMNTKSKKEDSFTCMEFCFPSLVRRSAHSCRGRPLWSPLEIWSMSFGRTSILCLLANIDYIIKALTVLSRGCVNLLNIIWVYCYSCKYVHVCFFIWNPNPLFIQKEEMEQRSGEFSCDWEI